MEPKFKKQPWASENFLGGLMGLAVQQGWLMVFGSAQAKQMASLSQASGQPWSSLQLGWVFMFCMPMYFSPTKRVFDVPSLMARRFRVLLLTEREGTIGPSSALPELVKLFQPPQE